MAFGVKNIFQGAIMQNYNEEDLKDLQKEYGIYLMDQETIQIGFTLIRDALIFTDKRIIFVDKQGATGTKTSIESINLFSVVDVKLETSGLGFDDSQLTFTYIKSPYMKAHTVEYASHTLEFPKKYRVQDLYKFLQQLSYENFLRLNGI